MRIKRVVSKAIRLKKGRFKKEIKDKEQKPPSSWIKTIKGTSLKSVGVSWFQVWFDPGAQMMTWDTTQESALAPFSHRGSSHDSQGAAAVPELPASRFKSSRKWRPTILANVSLAGLVHVAIPDPIRECYVFLNQGGITCLAVGWVVTG